MGIPDSGAQWYVARDGRQHGPISDVEMRKLVELGHLRPGDLIWRAGFADWRPAHSVFSSAPPAPTPSTQPAFEPRSRPQSTMPRFEATVGRPAQAGASTQSGVSATAPYQSQPVPSYAPQPQSNPQPIFAPQQSQTQRPLTAEPKSVQFNPQFQPQNAAPQAQINSGFEPRFEAAPKPTTDYVPVAFEEAGAQKSSAGRRLAIAASVALLIGGAGYLAKNADQFGSFAALKEKVAAFAKSNLGGGTGPSDSNEAQSAAAPVPVVAAPVPDPIAAAPEAATPETPSASMPEYAKALETKLQQFTHWQLIATEFPDWYRERVMSGAKLMADNKPESELTQYLAKSLVELRRSHADAALSASPETLKKMAGNFQGLVTRMGQEGAPVCMTFISSGEANPAVVDLANNPAKNAEINAHFASIFTAISEGRKAPIQHAAPADGDYKLLVAQLVKIGWTQAELELFADPKGASRTTPERYCKMMQDFFQAHLTLPDAGVQERLLHRTLKLVVAG